MRCGEDWRERTSFGVLLLGEEKERSGVMMDCFSLSCFSIDGGRDGVSKEEKEECYWLASGQAIERWARLLVVGEGDGMQCLPSLAVVCGFCLIEFQRYPLAINRDVEPAANNLHTIPGISVLTGWDC
jgi:hypothetical protein